MAHALPLTKLAGLLLKTLAKPLSKSIKHRTASNPLGKRILVGIGQTNHYVTSYMTIWSAGYKVRSIAPLDIEKALKVGADFVGEAVVVCVSGGIIVWEYGRSKEKDRVKNEEKRNAAAAERRELQEQLQKLENRIQVLEKEAEESKKTKKRHIPVLAGNTVGTNQSNQNQRPNTWFSWWK